MSQRVPPFAELLGGCQRSAMHLEMRDVYDVAEEDDDFTAWRAGHRRDPTDRQSWWTDFHSLTSAATRRGVEIRRARIVSEPVSAYIRYEHACTFQNIAAGESVRWLPRRHASDLCLPGNDFWAFDSRLVRFGLFSGEGLFVDHVLSDDPNVVKLCVSAFEATWSRAIPHEDYQV
jgi:hypothetical protein